MQVEIIIIQPMNWFAQELHAHAEVVKVDYNPSQISLIDLLKVFWECHDPTQGMRQGNDIGTQYRSVCYCEET